MKKLPQRVFNSPCIAFCNFQDGTHVNLIRLIKPYANGSSYAIHDTTDTPLNKSGLHKTLGNAQIKFDFIIKRAILKSPIRDRGITQHY